MSRAALWKINLNGFFSQTFIRFTRAECNCSRLGNYGIHIEFSFRMTHRLLIKLPKIWTGATKEVLADHLLLISCKFWREISLAALKTVMAVLVSVLFKFLCSNRAFGKTVSYRLFSIWFYSLQLVWLTRTFYYKQRNYQKAILI